VGEEGDDREEVQQVHDVAEDGDVAARPVAQRRHPRSLRDEGIQHPPWFSLRSLLLGLHCE